MTPKEKAQELFDKMCQTISGDCEHESYCIESDCHWKGTVMCKITQNKAKQCALIAVNEILEDRVEIDGMRVINDLYWLEVKKEIELL